MFYDQLIDTVEEATGEVTALHAKVDRLKEVESHNEQTLASFEENFTSSLVGMENLVQQYRPQQNEKFNVTSNHIGELS